MAIEVLFADPEHGPRSQMAEALLRCMVADGQLTVTSAGTEPTPRLEGLAELLAERGVPFVPSRRELSASMAPDVMIVVCEEGCPACPYLPSAGRIIRWPLPDPAGMVGQHREEALRQVADALEDHLRRWLDR